MAVFCPQCRKRLGSRKELPGHFRRAHTGESPPRSKRAKERAKARLSRPGLVPLVEIVSPKPSPVRAVTVRETVIEVTPSRLGIVPAKRSVNPIVVLPAPPRRSEPRPGYQMPGSSVGLVDSLVAPVPQRPQLTDAVVLRSQYHALMALAIRLDAGVGTEREQAAFKAALRGYNANYDRIAAGKNSSHLPALGGASPS